MSGDPNFSSVKLLMGFEGTNGATGAPGFTDESPAAHGTATVTSATISTLQTKFGATVARFSGSTPTVAFASSADWQFGSGPFTIEGWYWPDTTSATSTILALWGSGSLSFLLFAAMGGDNKLHWDTSTSGSNVNADIIGATSLVANSKFYAWCVDFDGSKYRLYLDGVMDGSFSTPRTLFNATATLTMGTSNGGGNVMSGYLDEVRITKGVARYASDSGYTIPAAAFPRSGPSIPYVNRMDGNLGSRMIGNLA